MDALVLGADGSPGVGCGWVFWFGLCMDVLVLGAHGRSGLGCVWACIAERVIDVVVCIQRINADCCGNLKREGKEHEWKKSYFNIS